MRSLCLFACLLAACVDPKLASTPAKGGDFANALYTKLSERFVECTGQPAASVAKTVPVADLQKRVDNSIAKKRLSYDRAQGKKCLDAITTAECGDVLNLFTQDKGLCDLPFVGLVAENGDCYESNECAAGTFCDPTSDCGGVCHKLTKLGGACGAGTTCELDTQCIGSLCRERANEGDTCAGDLGLGCKSGLFCRPKPDTPSVGVCTRPMTDGTCTKSSQCAFGYQCAAADPNATVGMCTATKHEGDACALGAGECVMSTSCVAGANGAPVCTVWGGAGATCGIIGGELVLCTDSWCGVDPTMPNAQTGTCLATHDDGADCLRDDQCTSGSCDPIQGVCAAACPLQ
jgi:hypothetical protein